MTDFDHQQPSGDRLAMLYQLTQAFNSTLDLEEVLNRVMDEVIAATHAERGFVMLIEDEPPKGAADSSDQRLAFKVARGLDQKTIEDPQFQISRSIVERVAADGEPILTSDAQNDARFNIRQSVMFLGLRAILCVPLKFRNKKLGDIYVDNRMQVGIFTHADLELLRAIASSAAIAIENARLYQVAVEKGRMERELQMARKVQAGLLPQEKPSIPGWAFSTRWKPAREVGGDYYDFIPAQAGKLGLIIADVTDKGMPAALFMASTRSILRASMPLALTPADGITQANRLISAESEDGLFVTLFYGLLNPETGELSYINAGHNPPLVFQNNEAASADELKQLLATGLQLGMEADSTYKQGTLNLHAGDFVLLYTDGVTDALDADKNDFGMARLQEVVLANCRATTEELLDAVEKAIDDFTGLAAQYDDMTMLVIKRLS
jgi:sigma-B regulation protein RsbU (phosphoserine phosphatase)